MPRFILVALAALAVATPAAAQPNVLLIVTDDQRWDTLGVMPTVQSELVGKGVTFKNAFVVNPVCCPSRSTILTGTYSHTNGVWGIKGQHGGFHRFNDTSTLATWLDGAGYRTGLVGKYLNGYPGGYVPPGWDRWFASSLQPNAHFDYGVSDGTSNVMYGREEGAYSTDLLAGQAAQFIRDTGSEPFFLYFAPKAPHLPYTPAPRHVNRFEGIPQWRPPSFNENDVSDKPAHVRNRAPLATGEVAEERERQLEMLLGVDEAVASLLTALEETGKLQDTLIIYTSDNGLGWGEHRLRHKVVPYEESIRVPLVIRPPGSTTARTDKRMALNLDLAQTIARAAGTSAPGAEGRSLLVPNYGTWRRSFLLETDTLMGTPAYCGFRTHRWKYVQYTTGEEELYNLSRDPYELRSKHRTKRALLMDYRKQVRRSECRPPDYQPLPSCTKIGTRHRDRLRGSKRPDWICARAGRDRINVRRGGRDVVRCGSGFDRVRADRRDVLVNCERRGRHLRFR